MGYNQQLVWSWHVWNRGEPSFHGSKNAESEELNQQILGRFFCTKPYWVESEAHGAVIVIIPKTLTDYH